MWNRWVGLQRVQEGEGRRGVVGEEGEMGERESWGGGVAIVVAAVVVVVGSWGGSSRKRRGVVGSGPRVGVLSCRRDGAVTSRTKSPVTCMMLMLCELSASAGCRG